MKEKVRFLGLDVHAETIAVAMVEPSGEVCSLGTIANRFESLRKLVKKLGPVEQLRACYEAGPTGYVLYWQLTQLGVDCAVIAPTLVPMKAGDRVKTDRRDAERLARSHRSGDLTTVWVPDEGSEALRDLVRAREAAKQDQLRARHRLSKFLLRSGRRPETKIKIWTGLYMTWVRQLRFAQPAQESTRLDYLHEVEHMAERVQRLRVSHYIGDDDEAHLLSVFGNDSDIGAITAAVYEQARFRLTFPDGEMQEICLGEGAICSRGSVSIPGRKQSVRHMIALSEELRGMKSLSRTYVLRPEPT